MREEKYDWLGKKLFKVKDYESLKPVTPWYFLAKKDFENIEQYEKWLSLSDLFPVNSTGITTHRDNLAIAYTLKELELRLRQFKDLRFDDIFIKEAYVVKDTDEWSLKEARLRVSKDLDSNEKICTIAFRPFDSRYIVYSDDIIDRPRRDVMRHMLKDNLGIVCSRQVKETFKHITITNSICDLNLTGTAGSYGSGYLFPLLSL